MNFKKLHTYFEKLGLEPEVALLYIALHTHGPQSISQLSRNAKVERTRIYRLLESLTKANLIEVETHYRRNIIKAAPVANLGILISEKEQDLKNLQSGLKDLEQLLEKKALSSPTTRVQFYQGIEGTKQMFWNETRAKSEVLCVLRENMQFRTNSIFFDRWIAACNKQGVRHKGIIGDTFLATQRKWYSQHSNERLENWTSRYIADETFPIKHSMVVFDNVVNYYNSKNGEVFGIEIYNQEIADVQRQFFNLLWEKAKPLDNSVSQVKN